MVLALLMTKRNIVVQLVLAKKKTHASPFMRIAHFQMLFLWCGVRIASGTDAKLTTTEQNSVFVIGIVAWSV